MIEVVAAVCLMSSPYNCKDVRLSFSQSEGLLSIYGCAHHGQKSLVDWVSENPNWRIARWTCRNAKQMADL